jgi:ABC-type Mn2+/Zn2+ transport system ATPase subunit
MEPSSSGQVIRAENVTVGYHHRPLISNLSLEIRRGEILGIVGPNGCGKTTILRVLLGLLTPLRGVVHRDEDLVVSYVPQRERIDTTLPITAREIVLMGRAARGGVFDHRHAADETAARQALARLGIETLGPRLFRNLSGGQQQRVLLARALAPEPDMIVLDEPTAGMDVGSEAAIVEFLRDLNRTHGITILIVTHLLSLVLNFASSVVLMGPGTFLHGSIDDVLREERLSELYGVAMHVGHFAGQRILVVGRHGIDRV